MKNSRINWTHHTANFWWGCLKVSDGCKFCYADALANRWGKDIWGPPATTRREPKIAIWHEIRRWDLQAKAAGERRRVFVMSMGDFLEDHPMANEMRLEAMKALEVLESLDVLLLTKRPENAERFLGDWWENWPEHVWMGTSIENQAVARDRIGALSTIPAKIHFLSVEPLLESVTLTPWLNPRQFGDLVEMDNRGGRSRELAQSAQEIFAMTPRVTNRVLPENVSQSALWAYKVNWVIVGGESGPNARPFEWDWARSIRDDCRAGGVAFWMKQGGGKKDKREALEDIPEDLRIRELPQ